MKNLIVGCAASLMLFSCSNSNIELVKKVKTDPSYIGKEVELSGKVNTKFSPFVSSNSKTWGVSLLAENPLNNQESESVSIKMNYGKGKNTIFVDVPDSQREYEMKDLRIYDNDGNLIPTNETVKIKGTVEKFGDGVEIVNLVINKG